jgi:hypothetical protein
LLFHANQCDQWKICPDYDRERVQSSW